MLSVGEIKLIRLKVLDFDANQNNAEKLCGLIEVSKIVDSKYTCLATLYPKTKTPNSFSGLMGIFRELLNPLWESSNIAPQSVFRSKVYFEKLERTIKSHWIEVYRKKEISDMCTSVGKQFLFECLWRGR